MKEALLSLLPPSWRRKYDFSINLRYAKYTLMLIAFALSCLIVAGVRPWG